MSPDAPSWRMLWQRFRWLFQRVPPHCVECYAPLDAADAAASWRRGLCTTCWIHDGIDPLAEPLRVPPRTSDLPHQVRVYYSRP